MLKISSFKQAEAVLARYIPLSREITGKHITLERMRPLMHALGNPERTLKIVHVAGTSGKTSTSYYIAALLRAAGKKVGLTVSPHIDSVTERVQIDLEPLPEQEFTSALDEFLDIINSAKQNPTYFELLIAFAYWYFAKAQVDYAVIETGLGGLHDGSNIADNEDKLCVITDIGMDHMQILGNSLQEIATQKAGIIHRHNVVHMYRQPDVIIGIFQEWCRNHQAELHFHDQTELEEPFINKRTLADLPQFQKRNFLLALQAYTALKVRDDLNDLTNEMLRQAAEITVPGRMDRCSIDGKTIIMDGAHNAQKMKAFVASFQQQFPGKKVTVLLALKDGKEYSEVLPLLMPITKTLIVCGFTLMQDTPLHSIDVSLLADAARDTGFSHVVVQQDLGDAYRQLLAETKGVGIITGSFYLIGELRRSHKELRYG